MDKNSVKGFTLLELLVVIIVIGVLASVAMPLLFRNIEHSRAAEALSTMGTIRRALDACAMQFNGDYSTCITFDSIGMQDPSGAPNAHFSYVLGGNGEVTAIRNNRDNGGFNNDFIRMMPDLTKFGTGVFAGIQ